MLIYIFVWKLSIYSGTNLYIIKVSARDAQITGEKEAFQIDLVFVFSQLGLMERQIVDEKQ